MNKRKICFILMLAVMVVIFYFSNQNAEVSGNLSEALAENMNITVEIIEDKGMSGSPWLLGLSLRKYAHILSYTALAFFAYGWLESVPKAMLVSYAFACSDEIHQLFVEGRAGMFSDTLVDLVGIVLGVVCFKLLEVLVHRFTKRKI